MRHTITAPSKITGVIAGVRFDNGKAETDSENALAYFLRRGYTVKPSASVPAEKPGDGPKTTTGHARGTPKED
ncbi:hypothetical protein [Streptomyces sp. NPDC007063]|uniref:hypothetical protein n=1 Tax=Streptomyces sp. NPDC007063 TaxID=3364772 RepID=UPI00367E93CD